MGRGTVWAVAGGKGGAGRTLLAANLAIQLARSDRRVVLIDLDLQCGQLHGALGFARVRRGLRAVASGEARLAEAAVETSIPHLRLIGGLQGPQPPAETQRILDQVRVGLDDLESEVTVLDCGSGRGAPVLAAFALADRGLLVTTPEPPALEAAVLFVEAHLRSCFERALPGDTRAALHDLLSADGAPPERLLFRDLMIRLAALDPGARRSVAHEVGRTRLELVLNMVRDEADEEAGAALAGALRKGLGVPIPTGGLVEHDPSVPQAVAKRRPLSQQFPNTPATRGISRTAARLLGSGPAGDRSGLPEWQDLEQVDHYRVLEVAPAASSKEIQSAYHVLRRAFDPETTPLAPLVSAENLRAILTRVEDAYRTLIFLESRVAYDRQMVEAGRLAADQVRSLRGAGLMLGAAPADPARPAAAQPFAPGPAGVPLQESGHDAAPAPAAPVETGERPVPASSPAGEGGGRTAESAGPAADGPAGALPLTGEALRAARLRLGQSLEEIAARTKIRVTYLQAIEDERFERLPPPVFLRGFVREFASCLGLPADEVARAFLLRREALAAEAGEASSAPGRRTA